MAKIVYNALLGNYGEVVDLYSEDLNLQGQKSSPTEVIYKDSDAGTEKIVLTGTGFTWTEDIMTAGTITGIEFTNKDGAPYLTLTNVSFTTEQFNDAYEADGVQGVTDLLLSKNDTVTGSKISDLIASGGGNDTVHGGDGNDSIDGGDKNDRLYGDGGKDYIFGGAGNDKLWGGGSSDEFHYSPDNGKDIVMDFDAKGGGSKQDYISLHQGEDFKIQKAGGGDDTVLNFGGGDTLTLLDVHKADFTKADIHWINM